MVPPPKSCEVGNEEAKQVRTSTGVQRTVVITQDFDGKTNIKGL